MCGNKLIKWHAKQVIIGGDCHKKLLSKCQRDLSQHTAGSRINVLHIVKIEDKAKIELETSRERTSRLTWLE